VYYPYLRGKQYELIALRELVQRKLINENITPILEPIKVSPSLMIFMETYAEVGKSFGIVQNPEYGSFLIDIDNSKNKELRKRYLSIVSNDSLFFHVFILNKNMSKLKQPSFKKKSIGICKNVDVVDDIHKLTEKYNIYEYMIPDERIFKREIKGEKILLSDNFKKQQRNVDYIGNEDEFFSDDHLYYKEENFKGFSDYSIVGKEFTESGFAPYAVAIHVVYFDSDKKLRIHHFVSDSNDDTDDTPGKLKEALAKLVKSKLIDRSTYAYSEFKRFYESPNYYSGLGVIKKLSIMHHIEIMAKYLQENIEL